MAVGHQYVCAMCSMLPWWSFSHSRALGQMQVVTFSAPQQATSHWSRLRLRSALQFDYREAGCHERDCALQGAAGRAQDHQGVAHKVAASHSGLTLCGMAVEHGQHLNRVNGQRGKTASGWQADDKPIPSSYKAKLHSALYFITTNKSNRNLRHLVFHQC
jgi:hypothetical protein